MNLIDLHVHSTASDGTLSPTELIIKAKEVGLRAVALTDHDTIDGIQEAIEAGEKYGIEVIAGIELAAQYGAGEIHILGLDIDITSAPFLTQIKYYQGARDRRNILMVQKLNEIGFDITMEELYTLCGGEIITRAHYARLLLQKGYTRTMEETFQKYLSPGLPAYVHREIPTPVQCIEMIAHAKGVAILAHPTLYKFTDAQLDELLKELKSYGLVGIETIYSLHTNIQEQRIRSLAHKYKLCITGGSDFHGANKKNIHLGYGKGNLRVPYSILENFRDRVTP